jgi:vitamin B12 transporter
MSWLAVLVCILPILSLAQDEIPTVEVRAAKEVSRYHLGTTSHFSQEKLETEPLPLAAAQIIKVPGVIATQNGGPGGRVSYFFRGTESRHVAFTLDGLKLNDPSNNDRQFDAAFFTSPFLKEMEVHMGPQPVLFGSDAMGGLVELTTRKGEIAPETRFDVNGGSFGTFSTSLSKDWKNNKNNGTLTATTFRTDGISRLNKKRFNATERDSADITQFTSSSEHRLAANLQTDLLFSTLNGHNELDGFTDDNTNDESENDQYIAQQKTQLKIGDNQALSYRTGYNGHQREIRTLAVGKENYKGHLLQHEVLHKIQFKKFNFLSGIATEHEALNIAKVDRSLDLHSVFVQSALEEGGLKFQAGVRADKHTIYGSFYTGSMGASFKKNSHILSAQYSQGYKAPTLYQLHATPLFGFPIGNVNLRPERNNSLEASLREVFDQFEARLSLFQNRLANLITFTNQGFFNQGRFITEGAEAAFLIKLNRLHIEPSATHQNFRKQDSAVLRRPYNFYDINMNYFLGEAYVLSSRYQWQDSRKDFDEAGSIVRLNPYETVDLGFKYVQPDHDFGIEIKNIFNREYENLYAYSVMPLSVFFHYGMKI